MLITLLHGKLNLGWFEAKKAGGGGGSKFRIGFLPVTCHLTCPVTHFINKEMSGEEMFIGRARDMPASFILAPMAIALREQSVKIKIVYLGHRDGSAVMVHKDSGIFQTTDLKGKRFAVPGRYANQRLIIYRELKKACMTLVHPNHFGHPSNSSVCPFRFCYVEGRRCA